MILLLIYAAIIILGIGLDQWTKYLVVTNLEIDASPDVKVWDGVLHIRCISNDGAAFGMLDDQRWLFMSISTVVIIGIIVFMIVKRKSIPLPLGIAMSLIVSGGIGNMIDRVALEYVIDFIYFVPINFPCFNVADSFVCIGAALMFLCILFLDDPSKKKKQAANEDEVVSGAADASSDIGNAADAVEITENAEKEDCGEQDNE